MALRLCQDSSSDMVYVLPGNPGMVKAGSISCLVQDPLDFASLLQQIKNHLIDLVIVGPEQLLEAGVVDFLQDEKVAVLGPTRAAAMLESSKAFSKEFMQKHEIPTAEFKVFSNFESAGDFIDNCPYPVVVKASNLAAGKGVFVCDSKQEAKDSAYRLLKDANFEIKAQEIVIEERLTGREVSAFALCDGSDFFFMGMACDYKRLNDDDQGPNTGGMGSYIPQGFPSHKVINEISSQVFAPVLKGMRENGTPFKGFLFAGLMIDQDKLKVIEFNARMGDPETQVLFPSLQGNLSHLLLAAARGELVKAVNTFPCSRAADCFVHVVLASRGYPGLFGEKILLQQEISIDECLAIDSDITLTFSGVGQNSKGRLETKGGRVLGVTAKAKTIAKARAKAYAAVAKINFEGAHWRTDVAKEI